MLLTYKAIWGKQLQYPSCRWFIWFHTGFFCLLFVGVATAWHMKKQAIVALSSTEAEYIAATLTAKEGIWLWSIIQELNILQISKFRLWCDNQSCVKITKNPKITDQNKHIRARYHFIRELVEEHNLNNNYTPTPDMWVDFLTKLVPSTKHRNCCKHIGLSLSH